MAALQNFPEFMASGGEKNSFFLKYIKHGLQRVRRTPKASEIKWSHNSKAQSQSKGVTGRDAAL